MKNYINYGVGILLTLTLIILFVTVFRYFIEIVSKPLYSDTIIYFSIVGYAAVFMLVAYAISLIWRRFFLIGTKENNQPKTKTKTKKS
jgi:hypothetical protein